MDNEKKTEAQQDDNLPEKQTESKRYLVFYIIALFSVALVLMLLSFVAQSRAQRELTNMGVQLQAQEDETEGVRNRMETLQAVVEEQTVELDQLRKTDKEREAALQLEREKCDALSVLLEAEELQKQEQFGTAKNVLDALVQKYTAERLDGAGEDDLLNAAQAALLQDMLAADVPTAEPQPAA